MALKIGTRALEKAQEHDIVTLNDLNQARHEEAFPGGQINKIIRVLPASIKPFITTDLTGPTEIRICIPSESQLKDILSLKSQSVHRVFMKFKGACEPISLSKVYKDNNLNSTGVQICG